MLRPAGFKWRWTETHALKQPVQWKRITVEKGNSGVLSWAEAVPGKQNGKHLKNIRGSKISERIISIMKRSRWSKDYQTSSSQSHQCHQTAKKSKSQTDIQSASSFSSLRAAAVEHLHLRLVTEVKDLLNTNSSGHPITFAVNHRIIEWFGLEGTLNIK